MRILNYLKSLLPTFGKDRVLEDCRLTRTEIKEDTAPAFKSAAELLKGRKFKAPELEKYVGIFGRMVKSSGSDNMVVTIDKAFANILENLDYVEDMITKTYSEEVATNGLTYLKANLLQFVECVGYVSKYARKFLVYIYICETATYEEGGTVITDSLTPAEIEWLDFNFVSFCASLNIACGNPNTVTKQFDNIPDIVVTSENAVTLGATMGEHKIDPFQMKLIPGIQSFPYHIRMAFAEYQADRYKASKEEVKLLQLRKLNLEKLSEGKADAAVQKEIAYMETRIQTLNFKLAKMEKENGL